MYSDLYGNGKTGYLDDFKAFKTMWITRDEERKIYEARQERKNNTIIALGILILTLLAFFGIKAHLESHSFLQGDSGYTSADYTIK